MKKILFYSSLVFSTSVFAQDYQMFHSDDLKEFKSNNQLVIQFYGANVDENGDSILFPSTNFIEFDGQCINGDLSSWIGPKIKIKSNGENIFYSAFSNDSISIYTKNEVGFEWGIPNSQMKLKGKIISKTFENFLGISDSVKTIEFYASTFDDQILDIGLTKQALKISKNYGVIRMFNFSHFPDFSFGTESISGKAPVLFTKVKSFELISSGQLNSKLLSWSDIYDYEIDDEFHIVQENSYFDGGYYSKIDTIIERVTNKESLNNNITYTFEINKKSSTYDDNVLKTNVFTKETVQRTYSMNGFPFKFGSVSSLEDERYYEILIDSSVVTGSVPMDGGNECVTEYVGSFGNTKNTYLLAAGGPYYSNSDGGMTTNSRTLIYSMNKFGENGEPLLVTLINKKAEIALDFEIFPNPMKGNQLNINSNFDFTKLAIINVDGSSVFTSEANSISSWTLPSLQNGVYLIQLSNNESIVNKRIVIQN